MFWTKPKVGSLHRRFVRYLETNLREHPNFLRDLPGSTSTTIRSLKSILYRHKSLAMKIHHQSIFKSVRGTTPGVFKGQRSGRGYQAPFENVGHLQILAFPLSFSRLVALFLSLTTYRARFLECTWLLPVHCQYYPPTLEMYLA